MRPLDSRGIPATAYAAGYERLREQAVSARPASGGDGLSVLARCGLAAWLHTRAEGVPLQNVQAVLGHADISTTMRYVHPSDDLAAVTAAVRLG